MKDKGWTEDLGRTHRALEDRAKDFAPLRDGPLEDRGSCRERSRQHSKGQTGRLTGESHLEDLVPPALQSFDASEL